MEWLISKWGKHCAHSFNMEYVTEANVTFLEQSAFNAHAQRVPACKLRHYMLAIAILQCRKKVKYKNHSQTCRKCELGKQTKQCEVDGHRQ